MDQWDLWGRLDTYDEADMADVVEDMAASVEAEVADMVAAGYMICHTGAR